QQGPPSLQLSPAAKKTIIEQSPPFIRVPEGASIKMTCLLKTEAKEEGVYLMRGRAADEKVTYVSKDGNRPFPNFNGRIEASGPAKNLTITLQQLRQSDSGLYYCLGVMHGADLPAAKGTGTLVIVTGTLCHIDSSGASHTQMKSAGCMLASWLPYVLVSLGLTLISLVGCILPRVNVSMPLLKFLIYFRFGK
uniref:Ig-like domain-containing protein n=1 Tax=Crocodylus porosus TaxID=8502 RepID=A0A7M4EK54_CROPO